MPSKPTLRVVLVNDGRAVKLLLHRELPDTGRLALAVRAGEEAEELAAEQDFDVSQVDFELPGIGRVETRRRQRPGAEDDEALLVIDCEAQAQPSLPKEMETEDLLAEQILEALGDPEESGEFLTKPMTRAVLDKLLENVPDKVRHGRVRRVRRGSDTGSAPILGDSEAMERVLGVVERIAAGSASVLVHGETGTGKTMVARRIHELSPRADQRFVAINCSAFQEQLLESELFGYEKGAFTGAVTAKNGLVEVSSGGSLFLDEIGDMSSAMQAKLLQVLDDGEYRRVGGTEIRKVNVRIIAATNKDLQYEVKQGRFREDLLFRLNVIHLKMPPLRDRRDDIPILIEHFLERYRLQGQPRKQVSPEALQLLMSYSWPGNVRELANAIEGLVLLALGDEITAGDLPPALRPKSDFELPDSESPLPMKEIERLHIQRTLRYTEGKKAPAARLLGVDIKTLNSKIDRYEIEL
ncbi:MAG: sigma-54 dependent transcriptional regulator [Thermoanaerobaculia bacterium]|nr:sigma-54 dependent transcriptional regulator [Thermoanaerobaculia bacterium]